MRTYPGMGGNMIRLNSKTLILTTQFIEEEVEMGSIKNLNFRSPDLLHNGAMTFTLEDNVVPIYFLSKHTNAMLDCFGIIAALAKNVDASFVPLRGKDGRKIGRFKTLDAGHPVLRAPFPMDCYLLDAGFRAECKRTDQGCTIPFADFIALELCTGDGEKVLGYCCKKLEYFFGGELERRKGSLLTLRFAFSDEEHVITFRDNESNDLWDALVAAKRSMSILPLDSE